MSDLDDKLFKENSELRNMCHTFTNALRAKDARIDTIKLLAMVQAEDEALWFLSTTASEAYLQSALRELHRVIEESK